MRTVAIVGGGISGLISIKCCRDGDLLPTCYEMTSDIGGLWNYDANAVDGKASVMKSTVINTSKEFMAFSDFPPPKEFPNYMHNTILLEYFRMYAAKFDLLKYIRFRRRVTRVEPADDYEQSGCWLLSSVNLEDGKETCEKYDAVMLSTGHHAKPRWQTFPGFDDFQGKKLHSWQYKTPYEFEDKNVVIVGIGNSALDMAVELGQRAKRVYLSTRRGAWIFDRLGNDGKPSDLVGINTVASFLSKCAPRLVDRLIEKQLSQKFDYELYGLKPKHRPSQQHPSMNSDLPTRILCGAVIVKPNIKQFTSDGRGVIFEDDSRVEPLDAVILSTGYMITFPYLSEEILSVKENRVQLYKFVWPPQLKHSTLAVMGLIQPFGAINPITELQARWAVRVFKGELQLPARPQMDKEIERTLGRMAERFVASSRHTIQVDHVDYCDQLADEIGCRPNILRYLFTDFKLGSLLLFGPVTPYRYRLTGPTPWEEARKAILTQNERVEYPLRRGNVGLKDAGQNWTMLASFVILVLIALILYRYFF